MDAGTSLPENTVSEYRKKYRQLKRHLYVLIQENETYKDELSRCENKLLKINRERESLLDRLSTYEPYSAKHRISSDSDSTDLSDSETTSTTSAKHASPQKLEPLPKSPIRKKRSVSKNKDQTRRRASCSNGHMTSEEVERHLESRASSRQADEHLMKPELASPTVPSQLFSADATGSGANDDSTLVIDFPD